LRPLKIVVIDLVTKSPTRALYSRIMNANLASIMPQVIGIWCEEEGHEVTFLCYTGFEDLNELLPQQADLVFIGAFTQSAQLAYAMSNRFRKNGALTVLGGPHARCYPQDAQKYFDYVLGFTDQEIIRNVLGDMSPHRPLGLRLSGDRQPLSLPGVRQRWKFIEPTLRKAPFLKIVPMLGSLGCPYTCSFCIDAAVPYQPLEFKGLQDDLEFLLQKFEHPRVGWHDPNFGVRFNDYMDAIEAVVPQGRIDFLAESSLSLLGEPNLKRLKRNGFKAILPGVESWYDLGNKSKTGGKQGLDKVRQVSDHVNLILDYIPYVQTNFVLGLDVDRGPEPFELTKTFVDMTPGAFPGYSLLSAFGQAARLNLEYQSAGRVLAFPFHFLNNNHAMNVRPKNYDWPEFYDRIIDLTQHSFSMRTMVRRARGTKSVIPKWMNFVRGISSEGQGRIKYHTSLRRRLDTDTELRRFFDQETDVVPRFYLERVERELGPLWDWLPAGAMEHDPNAYLKEESERDAVRVSSTG